MHYYFVLSMNNTIDYSLLCGLQNIGNTCYMNSVIQILVHNKTLQQYFVTQKFKDDLINNISTKLRSQNKDPNNLELLGNDVNMTITCQLYKLISGMANEQIIAPQTFKKFISAKNETFNGFSQNDGHELLIFILDSIHEDTKCIIEVCVPSFPKEFHVVEQIKKQCIQNINATNDINEKLRIINSYNRFETNHQKEVAIHSGVSYWASFIEKNFSIISHHFMGVYHSDITCSNCDSHSHTFDVFTTVSLEIPEHENTTLYDCLNKFTTSESLTDTYNCVKCNSKTSCTKKMTFWNVPDVLIFHLKRFKMTTNNSNNHVVMQKICSNVDYPFSLDIENYISVYNAKPFKYNLSAVIHHYGQCNGGHYISYSKMDNGLWVQFNDANVSIVYNVDEQIITDSSYVLMYTKN